MCDYEHVFLLRNQNPYFPSMGKPFGEGENF